MSNKNHELQRITYHQLQEMLAAGVRWIDAAEVLIVLKISKRTLQRYRSKGYIVYSRLGEGAKYHYSLPHLMARLEANKTGGGEPTGVNNATSPSPLTLPKLGGKGMRGK